SEFGWRTAYVGLALVPLLVAGPIVWLGFRPKETAELESAEAAESQWGLTLPQAIRTYRFWVLVVSVLAVYMAVSGIAPNLQPALIDEGFSAETAATVASVLGLSIMIGRVAVGFLIDKFWAPGVACAALLLPVVGCYLLLQSPSVALASLAAALIGFAAGAELDLMSFFTARYFGLKHYATIYSIAYLCLALGSAFAPTLFGRVYDTFEDYDAGFMIAGGLFLLGASIVLLLGRYPERGTAVDSQTP
ncbi:MAG: MFS transporter, partial [Pseudomonadota bacterium]